MSVPSVNASKPSVIASGAKQSRGMPSQGYALLLDCFTNGNYVAAGSQ
jgi:hypothetical protein